MGEKDITEKILADYNDVFADIMNGLLFAGEQKIGEDFFLGEAKFSDAIEKVPAKAL